MHSNWLQIEWDKNFSIYLLCPSPRTSPPLSAFGLNFFRPFGRLPQQSSFPPGMDKTLAVKYIALIGNVNSRVIVSVR